MKPQFSAETSATPGSGFPAFFYMGAFLVFFAIFFIMHYWLKPVLVDNSSFCLRNEKGDLLMEKTLTGRLGSSPFLLWIKADAEEHVLAGPCGRGCSTTFMDLTRQAGAPVQAGYCKGRLVALHINGVEVPHTIREIHYKSAEGGAYYWLAIFYLFSFIVLFPLYISRQLRAK